VMSVNGVLKNAEEEPRGAKSTEVANDSRESHNDSPAYDQGSDIYGGLLEFAENVVAWYVCQDQPKLSL